MPGHWSCTPGCRGAAAETGFTCGDERGAMAPALLEPGTAFCCCCCCCCHRAGEGATSATDSLRLAWSCPSCGGRNSKSHTLRIAKALLPQPTPSFPHPLFIFCPSQTQAWSQLGPLALLQAHEELQKAVKRLVLSRAAPQGEGGFLQERVKTLDSVGRKRDRGFLFYLY